jgi:hypothetical protein
MKRPEKVDRLFFWAPWIGTASFVVLLVAGRWPEWWKWVVYEDTPMTWMESIILFTIGLTGLTGAAAAYLEEDDASARRWFLLGAAFLVMSLDERFALHERVRDRILAPRGIHLFPFFWTAPGDFVLLLEALVGVATLPFFWPLFKERPAARRCLYGAVLASLSAVLMDSVDIKPWPAAGQRLEQFWEEILETAGMLLFLNAFTLAHSLRFRRPASAGRGR